MSAGGYVTDVAYVGTFVGASAPCWLDHVALLGGYATAAPADGFAWCDLGCGTGLTANVLAATHPRGSFHGLDLMPGHIESARRLAAAAGVGNAVFHQGDFAGAEGFGLPQFDYIAAHGVYSWVAPRARQELLGFVDRHLKPGGRLYLSYNAMPGRAADLPLQRLVRSLAHSLPGDSAARVGAAAQVLRGLAQTRAPALQAAGMLALLTAPDGRVPPAYLAHELLAGDWEPLCVTDVRAALRGIGLVPAGSATLIENYDAFALGAAARAALDVIDDEDTRELARDFLIDQHFRRDVYIRDGRPLDDEARAAALLDATYTLGGPAARVGFAMETPAGRLDFDSDAARRIVSGLVRGPRRLADLADGTIPAEDLLTPALVLCASGAIVPVPGGRAAVAGLNRAILDRLDGAEEIRVLALPCGTAIPAERGLLRRLRDGARLDDHPGWADFLTAQGLIGV
ncbi:MAG: methyltransferase regulatory domain-containing protein [Nevskia sp.]|nr:methyltransferase regulatory domain-containing protein [Nevskia sp.]